MSGWRRGAIVTGVVLSSACSEDRADAPTPVTVGAVHGSGIADRASPAFHGALLRRERWAGMLDAKAGDACGRCHEGSPATVPAVTIFAGGATPCTTCHVEAGGPLACATCHTPANAHGAHVAPSAASAVGLRCATCHPTPGTAVDTILLGVHGNGVVDVVFDAARVAPGASFDAASGACAVACHALGGARPRPRWTETTPMACGDCHASPPAAHFAGACSTCHAEANAIGTALAGGALHMNGHVDVGDGTGTCASCHGANGDPWPTTGAHRLHEATALTTPIACNECHVVPAAVEAAGHLDGVVTIVFAARASAGAGSPPPTWDGARCSAVACHGAKLAAAPAASPTWNASLGAPGACGACHGMPPLQHTPSTSCERSSCHGAEVARDAAGVFSITSEGRALHMNGVIDHAAP